MNQKASIDYLTYCGLYCKMCSIVATIPSQANTLRDTMQSDGWEYYGEEVYPEFQAFWKVLNDLGEMDQTSPLCIGGCGDPTCQIRVCAREKGLRVCAECTEFPCQLLTDFTRRYPFLVENGMRIREIGIDAWLAEQDELAARGITNKILCQQTKDI